MNNNNYFGNSYNPLPSYNYSPSRSMNTYAFVNGIEGAKSYQMLPNQTVLLMDSDNPICYMKQSNNIGQATIRIFKLEEVTEQSNKPNEYVLKSDFDSLVKKVDELIKALEKQI